LILSACPKKVYRSRRAIRSAIEVSVPSAGTFEESAAAATRRAPLLGRPRANASAASTSVETIPISSSEPASRCAVAVGQRSV
jgi:hypothetical protein